MIRRLAICATWAVGLVLLAWPEAIGRDLGTDVMGNIAPASQFGGGGSLVDRYPLSAFSLDYHTDLGITQLDGVPPTIAHWAAAQLWSITAFAIKTVIDLFTWAFSLDLLGGAGATTGALAPVAEAISSIYENVIGEAWMVAAIIAAGIWGIWKALIQRRYTETAGALAVSVVFVLIALFFVYQPQRTIGEGSRLTNTLSLAFLSGANRGTVDDPGQAKRQVADQLFLTLLYEPWVVLQFGGLRHCVDTDRLDEDSYPRPVGPHDPTRDVCRDHRRQDRDGHGGYAARFLREPAGSDNRDDEYEALRKGAKPKDDPQFAGYEVDKSDSPAVDIQQEGGAFQRLTLSAVLFAGALGAIVLLGFLSLAVILAQVVALVLLGFAPVALVIGIFPGGGHQFFRNWLGRLATAVFIKALYSLVLAIVVAVAAALASSTDTLGFLFSFGLQAIFFWAIFLYRKQITARLVAATTGSHYDERIPRVKVMQRGADIAARPFHALVASRRATREETKRQQSVIASGQTSNDADPARGASGSVTRRGHRRHSIHEAPSNGSRPGRQAPTGASGAPHNTPREPKAPTASEPSAQAAAARPRDTEESPEATPRAAHEDVMRRARELRDAQRIRPSGPGGTP